MPLITKDVFYDTKTRVSRKQTIYRQEDVGCRFVLGVLNDISLPNPVAVAKNNRSFPVMADCKYMWSTKSRQGRYGCRDLGTAPYSIISDLP